ncbi:MAG TPA: penicillin acylase family protein, partial [Steroidobacter sp.]|nr:penicillin acylase family protein [Steroidobacter sp.]
MKMLQALLALTGVLFACVPASAREATAAVPVAVDIDWSSLGVPHIQAGDRRSLGYGIGYAYAQDNACLLLDEILTVRGERSEFLGGDGVSSARVDNIHSDFYFRWLNAAGGVERFWRAQPETIRQLLSGYAAGFNRSMRETAVVLACRNEAWFRPIDEKDLARLMRRLLVEGGVGQFVAALASTTPPGAGGARLSQAAGLAGVREFATLRGSNAIAVGGGKTENGKGRLLANPHFPWFGAHRFYQMHLTIPGVLDVMGAALPGLPVVNIGFNRNLAWTHTVDQASHFTLHRLRLDPNNPLRYLVDGKAHSLRRTKVSIKVRERDG